MHTYTCIRTQDALPPGDTCRCTPILLHALKMHYLQMIHVGTHLYTYTYSRCTTSRHRLSLHNGLKTLRYFFIHPHYGLIIITMVTNKLLPTKWIETQHTILQLAIGLSTALPQESIIILKTEHRMKCIQFWWWTILLVKTKPANIYLVPKEEREVQYA